LPLCIPATALPRGTTTTGLRAMRVLVVVWLAGFANQGFGAVLQRESLRDVDPWAVCGDGSPAAYYFRASATGSNMWIVDLQGGGWCDSEDSCRERCKSGKDVMCTSSGDSTQQVKHGLFDPEQDPALLEANKAYLPYCTSDGHMGDGEAFGFQFRGARVVSAVFTALVKRHGLGLGSARDLVIFSGQSAGGRGAMVNLDYVPDMLGSSAANVDVVGFLDSPLWIDMAPFKSGVKSFGESCRDVYGYANVTRLGHKCAAAFGEAEQWKCIMGQYRMPHVETPYLLVAAQYDSFQLGTNVGHRPASPPELAYAADFARRTVALSTGLREGWPSDAARQNGVLSWACYSHATSLDPSGFDRQACGVNDTTLDAAVKQFLALAPASGAPMPLEWIDNCTGLACGARCGDKATARAELPILVA